MPKVVVVRVKNYLDKHLRNLTVNFIYNRQIVGELQLLQSAKITIFYAGRFLAQLIRSQTVTQFKHIVHQFVNRLAENKQIYYTEVNDQQLKTRREEIAAALKLEPGNSQLKKI